MPPTPQYIYIYIWVYMAIYGHIWVYMDIYGYIRLYVDIYGYIFMSFWKVVLFLTSGSVIVALYLPMSELSAPTPPIVDYFLKLVLWKCSYGPCDHFMFSAKSGIRLVFTTQNPLFEENTDFRFHCLFAKIHHAQGGKGFYFWGFPFGKGSYFLEIPILRIWVHVGQVGWIFEWCRGGAHN